MAKRKIQFPALLSVIVESPQNDEPFLSVTDAEATGAEDGQKVAVYRLAQVKTLRVDRKLEE